MSNIRGRFEKEPDKAAADYSASVFIDWRLYPYDIQGSIVHARMLGKQGIITEQEADLIVKGLEYLLTEIEDGIFKFKPELEDVHMNIEAGLIEKIGEVGGKLHTARSRNDQVALDVRLYTKDAIAKTVSGIRKFQKSLVKLAEDNLETVLPGYTHLQRAQPVLLAHHLLAYFEMTQRDIKRFYSCLERVDFMPLGSGAVAGVAYDIDRDFVAKELGFSRISRNSMDAVSDRDYIIEYESAASICMMHLSRLAEEMILWSSTEFGFIEIDDAYATGSSIMPQKKNPDIAELVRGKTGRVYGRLISLLTMMKGLPLAYNSDMQEDKEGFFDCVDTLLSSLEVFSGMLGSLKINSDKMEHAAGEGYILATDLADFLVKKGESFRNAHGIVARLVKYADDNNKMFEELSMDEFKKFSPLFKDDIKSVSVKTSLDSRNGIGGTSPEQVKEVLSRVSEAIGGDIDRE